ncbi:MAG TPA: dihydrofolate reductase family protein [Nitrososphaeraceae archaeon]|nr:dihydrofolate reductase family protein [Nitrososphaeraceae archaeon]
MNNLPKIVFSKTLEKVEWKNSGLIKENIREEILKIKQQPGKDLVLFGGANIASTLLQLGLIDDYRIIVNPVVLSNGKPFLRHER